MAQLQRLTRPEVGLTRNKHFMERRRIGGGGGLAGAQSQQVKRQNLKDRVREGDGEKLRALSSFQGKRLEPSP